MEVGKIKIAEDEDFRRLKSMCINHDDWKLEINKHNTAVWTKMNDVSSFKMVKVQALYNDVDAATVYDVLHDPEFRKTWDTTMCEGYEICVINPNNDIGYYALKCPPPLRNRDFVTQRSWLETGSEYYIINHSVNHENCPPKKGFIRGISFFTGYYIQRLGNNSCQMTYVSQSDPKGKLPSWAMNKLTHIMAPKVISRVYKACKKYHHWKSKHNPHFKPWLNPEQMMSNLPRFNPSDIKDMKLAGSSESLLEDGDLNEEDVNDDDL